MPWAEGALHFQGQQDVGIPEATALLAKDTFRHSIPQCKNWLKVVLFSALCLQLLLALPHIWVLDEVMIVGHHNKGVKGLVFSLKLTKQASSFGALNSLSIVQVSPVLSGAWKLISTTLSITYSENHNLLHINHFIHIHRDVLETKTWRMCFITERQCKILTTGHCSLWKDSMETNATYHIQSN
jgi:hypothetical protein